jgi:hypothetical protein
MRKFLGALLLTARFILACAGMALAISIIGLVAKPIYKLFMFGFNLIL